MTRWAGWCRLLMAAAFAAGCGGKPTDPGGRGPYSLSLSSGGDQSSVVAEPLSLPIDIRIRDGRGPASGVTVAAAVATGGGTVTPARAESDGIGAAAFRWTLGTVAGPQTLTITGPSGPPLTVRAIARPGPVASVDSASPGTQFVVVGRSVGALPVVKVTDRFGNGVPSVAVDFAPAFPFGGTIQAGPVLTDEQGLARLSAWTVGKIPGQQGVTGFAENFPVVNFKAIATPAALIAITPTGQEANVGTAVAVAPAIRALDGDGQPLAGVDVRLGVTAGAGSVDVGAGLTGADGSLRSQAWVLGPTAGANRLEVTTPGLPATAFLAIGANPPPAAISANAVGAQVGWFGNFTGASPGVRVVDATGRPVAGRPVTFSLVSGGGSLSRPVQMLDRDGRATLGGWRLGPSEAVQEVQATVAGLPPASFRVAAGPVPPGKFAITLRYVGNPPESVRDSIFRAAAARWASLIVGDLPDVPIDFDADPAECYPALRETVDDLVIFVRLVRIDGVGGILGAAGPCLARDTGLLPVVGVMFLDLDDLDVLEAQGQLGDVVTHEMAHVMGFGETYWRLKGLFGSAPPGTASFLGSSARAAYSAIVPDLVTVLEPPIELGFGPGTRFSHWRESVFGSELMTGFADGVNPLSAVTVAAMRDIGYQANDAIADSFTLAGAIATAARAPVARPGVHSVPWRGPLVTVDRFGRRVRALR